MVKLFILIMVSLITPTHNGHTASHSPSAPSLNLQKSTKNSHSSVSQNLIVLFIGQSKFLSVSKDSHIHITNKKVIKFIDQKNKIKLTGYKKGSSSIWVAEKLFKIFVFEKSKYKFYISVQKLIAQSLGLKLAIKNKKIVIQGQLHRLQDWILFSQIHRLHPTAYIFEAIPDDDIQLAIQNYFKKLCQKQNLPIPTINTHPQINILMGKNFKPYETRLNKVFSPYGLQVQIQKQHISLKPMIRIQVYITEIAKSIQQQIGIQWEGGLQAQILPLILNTSSLKASLQAISVQGQGQVLASPVLLTRSGSDAKFIAGGEVPITTGSAFAKTVTWKRYGIILNIKPEADHAKNIKVTLTVEVSDLDMAHAIRGIPAIKVNNISSEVNLKSGQLITLSGLIKNNKGRNAYAIPGLKDIPILGKLFSSQSFRDEKSELVVFIKPTIIN